MIQMKCQKKKTRIEKPQLLLPKEPASEPHSGLVAHILIPQQAPPDPAGRPTRTLTGRIIGGEGAGTGHLLIRDDGIIPPLGPALTHDVEVGAEAVLVAGPAALAAAPLRVPVRRTEVGDHHGDGLARARAVALARGRDVVGVGELVAGAAAGAAPGPRAAEEGLGSRRREERAGGVRGGLPGGEGAVGAAAAGAFLAVVVVLWMD